MTKPKAFIITIPLVGFSRHDNPKEIGRILKDLVQSQLKNWERFTGVVPFDINKVTVRVDDGSGSESPGTTKNHRRDAG
jgi:hypothetical protein